MADTREQIARKWLEEDHKLVEQSMNEYKERMKGKPTPSQEECDLAKLGASVVNKRDDGSGPELVFGMVQRQGGGPGSEARQPRQR